MFLKCALFVMLIYAVRGFFTTLMFPILSPIGFFACHSCVECQMTLWICAVFSIFSAFFVFFYISMYHAACKVELQSFNRWYSQMTFSDFFIKSCFFLCSVAAVLLLLLLLPLVSPVSTFLKIGCLWS